MVLQKVISAVAASVDSLEAVGGAVSEPEPGAGPRVFALCHVQQDVPERGVCAEAHPRQAPDNTVREEPHCTARMHHYLRAAPARGRVSWSGHARAPLLQDTAREAAALVLADADMRRNFFADNDDSLPWLYSPEAPPPPPPPAPRSGGRNYYAGGGGGVGGGGGHRAYSPPPPPLSGPRGLAPLRGGDSGGPRFGGGGAQQQQGCARSHVV